MRKSILLILLLSSSAAGSTLAKAPSQPLKPGESIYQNACGTCHATGLAQAPKAHDVAAWNIRFNRALDQAKKQLKPDATSSLYRAKAMDILVQNVVEGIGVMPAKGMCDSCSTKDYREAITYMMDGK